MSATAGTVPMHPELVAGEEQTVRPPCCRVTVAASSY